MIYPQGEKGGAGRRLLPACMVLMLALASPAGWCDANGLNPDDSPLRKFEKGARQAPSRQSAPSDSGNADAHNDDDDWLADLLHALFSSNNSRDSAPADGGEPADGPDISDRWRNVEIHTFLDRPTMLTMHRLDPMADDAVRRGDGDILIPYVRYDFAYTNVSSSISGIDNRLELGYGVISILADDYHLTDSAYGVSLTMDRYLLQYRLSINRRGELDFGVGETDLLGAYYTSLGTVSMAARFIVDDDVMLEFRPSWAGTVQDYEGTVAYAGRGWALKAGYRSMTSPGGTLQGPFIGLILQE